MTRAQTNVPTLKLITATTTDRRQSGVTASPVVNLTVQADERLLLTAVEAAQRLEIGRSMLCELIAPGEVESIHVRRLLRIPAGAVNDYVNRQRPRHPDPAA